jgi:tetratricopeptide (TPR) repeat protein
LLEALAAGDLAGGQRTGRESAALLVKTTDGFPMDIDLRVDHSNDPVKELRTLFEMHSARQQVIDANVAAHKGEFERAKELLIAAVARASWWPRVWIRAAQVAENMEEPTLALQNIQVAFTQNPAWADAEIGQGNYAELGASPQFHRWVSAEKEKNPVVAFERLRLAKGATMEDRIAAGRMLLEVGHAGDAVSVLNEIPQGTEESIELRLLRSAAYASKGEYVNAIAQCHAALKKAPKNSRVEIRMAELQREATR